MSAIAISANVTGAGTMTIAAPNTASNFTLTLPTNTGTFITTASTGQVIPKAALPTGSVLQVVQTTIDTQQSFTGATYTDVTGLSVSITPTSTSSKILVRYRINGSTAGGTTYHAFQILRDAIAVGNGAQGTTRTKGHSAVRGQFSDSNPFWTTSGEFLDSPATVSATTYKIQTATNGTTYINRSPSNTDTADMVSTLCSIIVLEIAA